MSALNKLRIFAAMKAKLALLFALVVPHPSGAFGFGYQLSLGLNHFRTSRQMQSLLPAKLYSPPKLRRGSTRHFVRKLSAKVATRDTVEDESLGSVSRSTLGNLHGALEIVDPIPIESVLVHHLNDARTKPRTSLQEIIAKLHESIIFAKERPDAQYHLDLTAAQIATARNEISTQYHDGIKSMTQLSHLLAARLSQSNYECTSTVMAKTSLGSEFKLSETIATSDLSDGADSLELASRQLRTLIVQDTSNDRSWDMPTLTDHDICFESTAWNAMKVHRVSARACAYNDLCNVASESIAKGHPEMDVMQVQGNMFDISITVEDEDSAAAVQDRIATMIFSSGDLLDCGIPDSAKTRSVQVVGHSHDGRKMEVKWGEAQMSIEVLTLDDYYMRQEPGFTATAPEPTSDSEGQAFSRAMLQWMFAASSGTQPPSTDKVKVSVRL